MQSQSICNFERGNTSVCKYRIKCEIFELSPQLSFIKKHGQNTNTVKKDTNITHSTFESPPDTFLRWRWTMMQKIFHRHFVSPQLHPAFLFCHIIRLSELIQQSLSKMKSRLIFYLILYGSNSII